MHSKSINLLEWLALLTAGGWFEEKAEPDQPSSCDASSREHGATASAATSGVVPPAPLPLTHHRAIRIFIEVNLEDIQLDLIKQPDDAECVTTDRTLTTPRRRGIQRHPAELTCSRTDHTADLHMCAAISTLS